MRAGYRIFSTGKMVSNRETGAMDNSAQQVNQADQCSAAARNWRFIQGVIRGSVTDVW